MSAPISASVFHRIVFALGEVAEEDIEWSQGIRPPADPEEIALEAIFVICNSGMQNKVARGIFERVWNAIKLGNSSSTVFGHAGKTAAIDRIWRDRVHLLSEWNAAEDKLGFCAALPWIGNITKYHLAKNFGLDVAKPDVHLQRLADREGTTPQALCERLAAETGYRAATVDVVLWRACAEGIIRSRTGEMSI